MDDTPVFRHHDVIFTRNGDMLRTHPQSRCAGDACSIHNPSDHPLRDAPQLWNALSQSMDRVCSHGVVHPDYDDFAFNVRSGASPLRLRLLGAHDCDGCCHWPLQDVD